MQLKLVKRGGVSLFSILVCLFYAVFTVQPVSAREKPQILLKQSAQQVWQREQVLISLEVISKDPFSRLEVDDFTEKGFSIIPFKQERVETKENTRLIIKWAVFPFVAGNKTLQLPRIRYRPNSGRTQTLDLKTLSLMVRKLPVYIPPTMPVGTISLQSQWNNRWLVTPDHLLEWEIKVSGKGVARETMPPISQQLANTKSVHFLPIQSTYQTLHTGSGVTHQGNYKIPLKILKSGKPKLPAIAVQFFEPKTGKLQIARIEPPFIIALNQWILWLLGFIILFFGLVLLLLLLTSLRRFFHHLAQRKHVSHLLDQANSYQQIRNALNKYCLIEGWNKNLSLNQFIQQWAQKNGANEELKETIKRLQSFQFSKEVKNGREELNNISQHLRKILF